MDEAREQVGVVKDGDLNAPGDHGNDCANCRAALAGPYCHACGQPAHLHRNLGGLLHDIAHGVFHFEGRMWHTLPLLAWRPGELTRRYVHGERARFVSPMALFLFCVFLMFAVFSLIGRSGHGEGRANADARTIAEMRKDLGEERAKLAARATALKAAAPAMTPAQRLKAQRALSEDIAVQGDIERGMMMTDGVPAFSGTIDTGWPWLDRSIRHAQRNPNLLLYKIKASAYKFSWALIPLSLPFLWLLFPFRSDVGLYDHAIFATYSLSFMTLFVIVLAVVSAVGVTGGPIFLALAVGVPVHMYRQLKGAYLLGRASALWRTAALLVMTLVVSILFALLLLWMGLD